MRRAPFHQNNFSHQNQNRLPLNPQHQNFQNFSNQQQQRQIIQGQIHCRPTVPTATVQFLQQQQQQQQLLNPQIISGLHPAFALRHSPQSAFHAHQQNQQIFPQQNQQQQQQQRENQQNYNNYQAATGDMVPVETVVARLETACRLLHGIGGNVTRINEISHEIQILSEDLRRVGPLLETTYPEVLDRVMSSMRDASTQPSLHSNLRLAIFELVELRASKWLLPSDSSNYYRQRRNLNNTESPVNGVVDDLEDENFNIQMSHHQFPSNSNSNSVSNSNSISQNQTQNCGILKVKVENHGILKPEPIYPSSSSSISTSSNCDQPSSSPASTISQKCDSPTNSQILSGPCSGSGKGSAKTYKEEILIKNTDSGKVSPTAKERVLSINGYSQQSISMAKQLIQETIVRNSSPVFDGIPPPTSNTSENGDSSPICDLINNGQSSSNSLADLSPDLQNMTQNYQNLVENISPTNCPMNLTMSPSNTNKYTYTVSIGDDQLKIQGSNLNWVQEAKLALDDYFSTKYPHIYYTRANSSATTCTEDEDFVECINSFGPKYDRETLLNLSKKFETSPPYYFQTLAEDLKSAIVLEKPRPFDPNDYFTTTTSNSNSNDNKQDGNNKDMKKSNSREF